MNANLKEIKRIIGLLRAKEDPNELLMRISMGRAVQLIRQLRTKVSQCEELTDELKATDSEVLDDCNDQLRTLYLLVPCNAGGGKVEKDITRNYFVVMDYIIEKLDKIATCINHHLERHLNYQVGRRSTQRRNAKRMRRLRIAILKTKKAIKLNNEANRQLKVNIEALRISILALKTGKMEERPPKGTILREEPFWKKPTLHVRCKAPYCRPNWRHLSPSLRCMLKTFKTQTTSPHMFKTFFSRRINDLPTVDYNGVLEYSNSDYPSYIEPPIEFQDVLPVSPVTAEEDWHVCIDDICQTISVKDSSSAVEIEDIWHVFFYAIDYDVPKYEVGRVYVDTYVVASPKSIETLKIFLANPFDGEERQGQFLPHKICYFENQCDLDRISGKTYLVGKIPESTDRGAATTYYEEYPEDLQEFRIEEFQDDLPDLEIEDANVFEPPEEDSTSYKTAIDNDENWYGEECQKDIQDLNSNDLNCWYILFYEIDHTLPKHAVGRVVVKIYVLANPKSTENSEIHSPRLLMTTYLSCQEEVKNDDDLDKTLKESPKTYETLTTPIDDEECQDDLQEFKIEDYQNVLPDLKSNDSSSSTASVENDENWHSSLDDNSQINVLKTESTSDDSAPYGPLKPPVGDHKAYFVSGPQPNSKFKVTLSTSSEDPPSVVRQDVLHYLRVQGPSGFKAQVDDQNILEETPSGTAYPVNYFWMELTFGERRQSMLHWCKSKLQGYGIPVSDFTASWKNGRAFVALIHCHHKHLIEERFLTKESATNTLNYGAQIARCLGVNGSKDFVQECLKKQPSQFKIMPFVEQLRICLQPPRS